MKEKKKKWNKEVNNEHDHSESIKFMIYKNLILSTLRSKCNNLCERKALSPQYKSIRPLLWVPYDFSKWFRKNSLREFHTILIFGVGGSYGVLESRVEYPAISFVTFSLLSEKNLTIKFSESEETWVSQIMHKYRPWFENCAQVSYLHCKSVNSVSFKHLFYLNRVFSLKWRNQTQHWRYDTPIAVKLIELMFQGYRHSHLQTSYFDVYCTLLVYENSKCKNILTGQEITEILPLDTLSGSFGFLPDITRSL